MNETRRKPTTGRQSPFLFDKWHGIFYMPSHIDEAGHTRPLISQSRSTGGKAEMFSSAGGTRTDTRTTHPRTESVIRCTVLQTSLICASLLRTSQSEHTSW